jgi:hypothetical protein
VVIVAGHLVVDPKERDGYLAGCVDVVELARRSAGCLLFDCSLVLSDTCSYACG